MLVVIQAMDTGGKDGLISHVMSGVNPQGCSVASFKTPTAEELAHDYLWRVHKVVPPKRMIGIFNRSHYEDVLVVRVHSMVPKAVWRQRYEQINAFEKQLAESGVTILKFFLHISKEEQKARLQARLDDPAKHWKFSLGDLKERVALGRLHGCVRGCAEPDQHAVGAVVPGAGEPQMVSQPGGGAGDFGDAARL